MFFLFRLLRRNGDPRLLWGLMGLLLALGVVLLVVGLLTRDSTLSIRGGIELAIVGILALRVATLRRGTRQPRRID